jgi:hypothetical protein
MTAMARSTTEGLSEINLPREHIAIRAYELYLERGATDGHDVEDWLQAEREVAEQAMVSAA